MSDHVVCFKDVQDAHKRIARLVHRTPVMTCSTMDRLASEHAGGGEHRQLFFKVEAFQKSGSFKARGACNAVCQLPDGCTSVSTHSSGNHAQALALAAQLKGVKAHIVMPSNAPALKRKAVEGYGARVIECAPTQAAREATAAAVTAETGSTFVHPSEDPRVIAGQGTIALELIPQVAELIGMPLPAAAASSSSSASSSAEAGADADGAADADDGDGGPVLDAIVVPIGGGGMTSGIAVAAKGLDPRIRIIAAEPAAADDAARSKAAGCIQGNATTATIADGLKTTLGPNTWPVVRDLVERVVTVSEAEIVAAMRLVYERMKIAIEPSAAVGVAAVLYSPQFASEELRGLKRVGVILCGGNADVEALPFAAVR